LIDVQTVLTSRDAVRRAREFLSSLPTESTGQVSIRIDGRTDCEVVAKTAAIAPVENGDPSARLALLRLDNRTILPHAPLGQLAPGSTQWFPPGQAEREGAILGGRDGRGRSCQISEASFLDVDDLTGLSGLPVFQGGRLVGMVVEPSGAHHIVTASVCERLIKDAEQLSIIALKP
jgi:hypothetical protein